MRAASDGGSLSPPAPRSPVELDVDVESLPGAGPAKDVASAFAPVRREAHAGAVASPSAIPGLAGSSSEAAASPSPSSEPSGAESWTLSPTVPEPGGDRLSSAALESAVRAGIRATVAESRKRVDPLKQVLGGISQHDIELGLVPGGEFVAVARDTVRRSVAPMVGYARLEFQIDAGGSLTSVHVIDASSNDRDWNQVAEEIAKAARARRTRVPSGARGVALTLDVTSAVRTVTGGAPTDQALVKVLRAVGDPIDAIIDGTVPAQRVVAAHVVDVHVL